MPDKQKAKTPRQEEKAQQLAAILWVVSDYTFSHGLPPTQREIKTLIGVASTETVSRRVKTAIAMGLIQNGPRRSRTIRITEKGRALMFQYSTTGMKGGENNG